MDTQQFYPTPRELLEKVFEGTDWRKVTSVLEHSAGNGDICDYIMEKAGEYAYHSRDMDMDCIELNSGRQGFRRFVTPVHFTESRGGTGIQKY